jgi:hypothetical protein
MTMSRRIILASIPLTLLMAAPLNAASKSSWDGTWSGLWGGQRPTSITIVGNKVVSFEYQGISTPVAASTVTTDSVTYGDNGNVVTLTRKSKTTAFATIHSPQGDATADMTRQ